MAQSGYTPILIYGSGTATNVPLAANLTSTANGAELALNYADGKLYYKNSAGTVTLLADKISVSVASANGFAGSVAQATATSTPAITISTTISGVLKGNGTAISAAVSGTDYAPATSGTSILKGSGTGGFSNAVSGTDYAPATSGASILYGNSAGGFSNVTIGTGISFAAGTLSATGTGGTVTAVSVASANGFAGTSSGGATPALTLSTTISGVLKGNGTAISAAVSGTDYAPATSGTSILYGNGSGGFSNVTIGSNLTFAGGTLSASGGGTWTVITTTTTASSGSAYLVDTSAGSFTVSLPATPSTGAAVTFSDRSYTWDRYPVTIGRNGQTIETLSEDMICSIQEASFTLVFDGSTWRLV